MSKWNIIPRALIMVIVACVSLSSVITAQTEDPSPDNLKSPEAFVKDMEKAFAIGNVENAKWIRRDFSYAFLSENTPSAIQDTVISTVNHLQAVHIKNSSGVLGYLKGVYAQLDNVDDDIWDAWHDQIHSMISNKPWRKRLVSYLQHSSKLFTSNIISNEATAVWQFKRGTVEFGVDSMPFIKFSGGDLVCYAKGDSARIRNTSGTYFPTSGRWKGHKGRVHWEGTTFNDSTQYAVLNDYEILLKGSSFKAESVLFHSELFDHALSGDLRFKVKATKSIHEKSYPRFESSDEILELKNIFPNMDFEGGIVVRGSRLDGISVGDTPGYLKIYSEDTLFIRCAVNEMLFQADGFSASMAEMSIYLDEDSIYHPSVGVRYDGVSKVIRFIRDKDGIGLQAFSDSYHKMDFQVDALTWKVGGTTIDLGSLLLTGRGIGVFRSQSNFDARSFNEMMSIAPIHPLVEMGRFIHSRSSTGFYSSEYADYLKLSEVQARLIIIELALEGYLDFDVTERWCEWLPKAENHLLCKRGKIDYDVIAFRSVVPRGANARLGLSNKILEIEGLSAFKLSRAQDVVISPKYGRINMSKDRNFAFSGGVKAGKFEFRGTGFEFDYNSFLIELTAIEETHIRAEIEGEVDEAGYVKTRLVRNTIDGITGTLQIDNPLNRSGWRSEQYTHYPVLTSEGPSYVYYDSPNIHNGAYHRNRFRYALDPFEIDSLDNFVKADMRFSGELLSGGIIPDLDVDLRLMDDFSLGLIAPNPPGGFPLYEGLGVLNADVKLNMNGLQGEGSIAFLTSRIEGDEMILVPDSAFGTTSSYINTAVYDHVPSVQAGISDFTLNSKEKMLEVRSNKESLRCFGEDVMLGGAIQLNESGMTANGEFEFDNAHLTSDLFVLGEKGMKADSSRFEIEGSDLNALAFKTNNVMADVDFRLRIGDFVSHDGNTQIDLPAVRYLCSMNRFRWYMDESQIELENTNINGEEYVFAEFDDTSVSNFISTHPSQDSLSFSCSRALYNVEDAIVKCYNVSTIAVADAEIWPDSGNVVIRRDAVMDEFVNSQIYANDITRYHRFFDATIKIKGKLDYDASGSYLYKDAQGIDWPIHFSEIKVDTTYSTIARGRISVGQEFYLDPYFEFSGDVELEASRKNLNFDGGARMVFQCDEFDREWVQFHSVIDPEDVAIPIDSIISEVSKAHLGVGVILSDDAPFTSYPAFFTRKPDRGDMEIFKPEGALRYDRIKKRYVVCTADKLRIESLPGTLIELPEKGCGIYSTGMSDLPFNFSIIDHKFVGSAWVSESGKIQMRGSLALNIYIADELERHLADQIKNAAIATPLNFNATNYEYALRELAGMEMADNAVRELSREGTFKKVPKEIRYTFMLTGLEFTYDAYEDSFISTSKLGIATIGEDAVFRSIPGRVELVRDRGRDELVIYFHLSEGHWYYFSYDTFFNFETNDNKFMTIWNEMKDKHKKLTHPETGEVLKMQVSRSGMRDDFVDRFRDFE